MISRLCAPREQPLVPTLLSFCRVALLLLISYTWRREGADRTLPCGGVEPRAVRLRSVQRSFRSTSRINLGYVLEAVLIRLHAVEAIAADGAHVMIERCGSDRRVKHVARRL